MARTVVIDWQRDSLLVGVGVRRGSSVAFEQVRLLPLGESEQGTVTAGQALRKAIQELEYGKSDAIVIASREVIEIRTLSVPNVEQDELPDIIRFQAQRQMANMGETWPLDYILLPSAGLENRVALAAAISPAHMAEIENSLAGAGLQLSRVLLRPLEIARFALTADTTGSMKDGASVVVCLTDSQADLLLLNSGAVVQLRSTRLPTSSEQIASTIVGEIKRSLVAAASQLNGVSLTSAMLISPAELASKVEQAVSEAVGCNVAVVDPGLMLPSAFQGGESLTHSSANRLAAIAGVVGSPQPDKRTLIDFKNPKKRPPKEVNFRRYVLACAAAGLLLLAAGSWWYTTNSSMDRELASLKKDIADKKELGELALKQIAEFNEVKKVLDGSPNWLDEVERIAMSMPENVILFSPTMSVGGNGEGFIKSKVYGVSAEELSNFENKLREEDQFRVSSAGISRTDIREGYPWETMITISFTNRGWNLLGDGKPAEAKKPVVKPQASTEVKANAQVVAAPPAASASDKVQVAPASATEPKVEGDRKEIAEPASKEPASTEPASKEPASTEPASTEPATEEPATKLKSEGEPLETPKAEPNREVVGL